MLPPAEFYLSLPKKHIGTGVILLAENGDLLLVKPTYKNYWTLPGGMVDDNESPRQAGIREVKEELSLDITSERLLGIIYRTPPAKPESLQFVFYGGILKPTDISRIKLPVEELSDYKILSPSEATKLMSASSQDTMPKLLKALKDDTTIYLENSL